MTKNAITDLCYHDDLPNSWCIQPPKDLSNHIILERGLINPNYTAKPFAIEQLFFLPLARQAQLLFHMRTAWIWMRRRVTRRLTQIQAV